MWELPLQVDFLGPFHEMKTRFKTSWKTFFEKWKTCPVQCDVLFTVFLRKQTAPSPRCIFFIFFSLFFTFFPQVKVMFFTGFSLTFSHAFFQVLFCLCMPVCLCLSPYVSTCLSLFLPVSGRLSLLYLFVCLVLGVCVCLSVCLCLCLVYVYMSPSW